MFVCVPMVERHRGKRNPRERMHLKAVPPAARVLGVQRARRAARLAPSPFPGWYVRGFRRAAYAMHPGGTLCRGASWEPGASHAALSRLICPGPARFCRLCVCCNNKSVAVFCCRGFRGVSFLQHSCCCPRAPHRGAPASMRITSVAGQPLSTRRTEAPGRPPTIVAISVLHC